jgi:hypothetical protein
VSESPNQRSCPAGRNTPAPFGIALWLMVCASMSTSGWVLSALHELNVRGYVCVVVILAAAIVFWERSRNFSDLKLARVRCHRLARRFKHPLPLGFLIMAGIALVGGLIYAPVNYDALAYRVPRVLHWLANGQWHWVHTEFPRLNVRACGAEWLMAPIIAFTKTVRWTFLPNVVSFLLLPGLLYSVFIRLGVGRKAAWNWMWITTTGHSFVMQAGGIANDLPGAVYALAAFDFALRLRTSGRLQDFWLFMIAAGLLTGAKASNVPLLLPAFILILPHLRLLLVQPVANVLVMIFAGFSSFVPTAILNWKFCHDWTGMRLEGPMQGPLTQLVINFFNWILLNFIPPIFPLADQWNQFLTHVLSLSADTARCFRISAVSVDEGEALGMGVCLLLLVSCLASRVIRRRAGLIGVVKPATLYWKLVLWSPYLALLVFGLKAQTVFSSSRLITPYYAILMAPLLVFFFDERVIRRRWWKCAVAAVFVLAISLEILMPARPLWPAQAVLTALKASHPSSAFVARSQSVYSVYAGRSEGFAPLVAALPTDAKIFGMVTFDDPETSLWMPLGSRRIEHVTRDDTPEKLAAKGIKYILAPQFCYAISVPVEDVIRKYDAKVFKKIPLLLRVQDGPVEWYILEINPGTVPVSHL